MGSCAILVTVLLWYFFGHVDTTFYIEYRKWRREAPWFRDPAVGKSGQFDWFLQKCKSPASNFDANFDLTCTEIETPKQVQRIYERVNFISVSQAEVSKGQRVKIDGLGEFLSETVSEIMTLGIDPRDFHKPHFKALCGDADFIQTQVDEVLGHFLDDYDEDEMKRVFLFFAIHNIGFFATITDKVVLLNLFGTYEAIMKKVISEHGYDVKRSIEEAKRDEFKPKLRTQSRNLAGFLTRFRAQSKSVTTAVKNRLPQSVGLFDRRSKSQRRPPEPRASQSTLRSRSLNSPLPSSPLWSPPQSPHSSPSVTPSPHQSPLSAPSLNSPPPASPPSSPPVILSPLQSLLWSRSLTSLPPASPPWPPRRSPPSSPSQSPREKHPLKVIVREATGLLSLKMFDPCYVLGSGEKESAFAESLCTTNCQFMSMAIEAYEYNFSERCKFLQTGKCENKMCVCGKEGMMPREGVKMVFCNNALRLHIYDRVLG